MRITANRIHAILSRLVCSMPNLASQNDLFCLFSANFQDNHPEISRQSPVCPEGVSKWGCSSTTAIGQSNDYEWVFNEALAHAVVQHEDPAWS